MIVALTASFVLAVSASSAPAAPSPAPTALPSTASTHHSLALAIPPGWRRTETGTYNEWLSPDGHSRFRVAIMSDDASFHGPNATNAVTQLFVNMARRFNPKAQTVVKIVQVCDGTQTAYRVDDPLGVGTAGLMVIIPGTDSSGLVNYEVAQGQVPDPAIMQAIDKICWP